MLARSEPVNSGPTSPPASNSLWHWRQALLKTSRPRAGVGRRAGGGLQRGLVLFHQGSFVGGGRAERAPGGFQ